jgi:hypothetical protein
MAKVYNRGSFINAFSVIGVFGIALRGWIPVIVGAFWTWYGKRLSRKGNPGNSFKAMDA